LKRRGATKRICNTTFLLRWEDLWYPVGLTPRACSSTGSFLQTLKISQGKRMLHRSLFYACEQSSHTPTTQFVPMDYPPWMYGSSLNQWYRLQQLCSSAGRVRSFSVILAGFSFAWKSLITEYADRLLSSSKVSLCLVMV
jgi:hypothetical protein